MEKEPSVLDYVKARLTPWRGPAPQIPPAAGVMTPEGDEGAPPHPHAGDEAEFLRDASGGSRARSAEQLQARQAESGLVLWPWRSLGAVASAMVAQSALEPPDRSVALALTFYAVAISLALLSHRRGEWALPLAPLPEGRKDPYTVRFYALLVSFILAVLAFLTFGNNRFNALNISLWGLALVYLIRALWLPNPNREPWTRRVREFLAHGMWQLRLTPYMLAMLVVFLLAAFFRLYRLSDVPPEMFSDHAEKLMDVADVLRGEYSIFFPRNTGREAFQMYLTAMVARLFGTGLSFMSLKLGTALAGLFTLPFIYLLGVEVGNRRVGLLAALFAGIAYWPNVISRVALRFTLYPFFVAPTLYFLVRGLRRMNRNDFILAGISLGLGLNGYSTFRIVPFVVVAAVGLYLIHRQTKAGRRAAVWGLIVLGLAALFVFLPLLRYAVDNPETFSYRTLTRMSSVEVPLSGPAWRIFLDNLWKASIMFFWSNGDIWVHSVTNRPALDVVSATLFGLGAVLLGWRYIRRRDWLDLFLLVSIPLFMLSSVLSLAFPGENPSLNRTGGAIVPVFVIIALALDGLLSGVKNRANLPWGPTLAWGVGGLLIVFSAFQNYELIFDRYYRQFQLGAWNTSEIGHVIRGFADSVGDRDSAWVVPFPHWVDTRLVGINAGFPEKDYALDRDLLEESLPVPGPKLFIFNPQDGETLEELRRLYPQGVRQTFHSKVETKDFDLYLVLPDISLRGSGGHP